MVEIKTSDDEKALRREIHEGCTEPHGEIVMKIRTGVAMAVLASMPLLSPGDALAQVGKRRVAGDPFVTLKVGHWIQLEGTVQKDYSVLCTEVKLLTGDFLDDDWSLRGVVRSVDAGRREFVIGRYRVRVREGAAFESERRSFGKVSDLRVGMLVEVEGSYRRNGILLANEVDDESDKISKRPGVERRIRIVGKVERVDARRRRISAMGTTFQVTEKTQVKSVLR